jgi:magnesium chelatase family protein
LHGCRCGYFNDPDVACRCPAPDAERYVRKISGPLLDRIDLRVEMARVAPSELLEGPPPEDSATVAARIAAARGLALQRNGGRPNAQLSGAAVSRACALPPAARRQLSELAAARRLSARGVHKVMRVARSIADLAERATVDADDLYAASALHESSAAGAAAQVA